MIKRWKSRFWANVTEQWFWVFSGAILCIILLGLSQMARIHPMLHEMFWCLSLSALIMEVAGTVALVRTFRNRHAHRNVDLELILFMLGACLGLGAATVIGTFALGAFVYLLALLGF